MAKSSRSGNDGGIDDDKPDQTSNLEKKAPTRETAENHIGGHHYRWRSPSDQPGCHFAQFTT